jgi:hypothetical protein
MLRHAAVKKLRVRLLLLLVMLIRSWVLQLALTGAANTQPARHMCNRW